MHTLNENTIKEKGGTLTLKAQVSPNDAVNKIIAWSSDNPAVATVDANGVVTAVSNGTVKITATATDGSDKSAEFTVTVDIPAMVLIDYSVIQNFGTWAGSGTVTGIVDATFSEFVQLARLDNGTVVDPSYYDKASGSTINTLKESYLNTLADGVHTFRAVFTDGYADLKLTTSRQVVPVKTDNTNNTNSPQTGDEFPLGLLITLMGIAGAGVALIVRRGHIREFTYAFTSSRSKGIS